MKRWFWIFLFSFLIASAIRGASPMGSRLAVINGKIITMSEKLPEAEAMVIEAERIIYVGNTKQALKICGPECWILDLNGLSVIPGFNSIEFEDV